MKVRGSLLANRSQVNHPGGVVEPPCIGFVDGLKRASSGDAGSADAPYLRLGRRIVPFLLFCYLVAKIDRLGRRASQHPAEGRTGAPLRRLCGSPSTMLRVVPVCVLAPR